MAPKALATYDPSKVVVTLDGNVIDGFASGTFLKVTTPELYTDEAGINAVARLKTADRRCTVELTLIQTSNAHLVLDGIKVLDEGGNGVGPLIIKDFSGNTIFSALTCWISKEPEYEFGSEIANWTWTLRTDDYTAVAGGN